MAIINCPECSNSVSDKATVCPRCGYPILTSRIRKNLSEFLRIYLYVRLLTLIKFVGRFINKIIKTLILLISLLIIFISSKNYYFTPLVENFALQSCIAASGTTIKAHNGYFYREDVQVPGDLTWTHFNSRVGGILDWKNFNFELPGVGSKIDVKGRDEANNPWSCTPYIVSRSMFGKEPYSLHGYVWLHQSEY